MQPDHFAATLLRSSAPGLAGLAAGALYEEGAQLDAAEEGFGDWKAHLQRQVIELAAAVEAGAPTEYAGHVSWAREAFEARDVPVSSLRASVEALRQVVADSMPEAVAKGLDSYFESALSGLDQSSAECDSLITGDTLEARLSREYLELILAGRGSDALRLLLGELEAERLAVADVLEGVLAPVMREVGSLWHRGHITASDEHFASTTTQRALSQAIGMQQAAEPNGKSVLVTSVAGDAHGIGVQVVSSLFELDGWRCICLGIDTPTADLVQAAVRFEVSLVALGATLSTQRNEVASAIRALKSARPTQPILVGGSAFGANESAWRLVGADAYAQDAREAVRIGRGLVGLEG